MWETLDGNFFGSTVVMLRATDPPAPALALAAGLALIEAVEVAAPDLSLSLKWPNDLMLGDAKLGGILLERSGDRVVAGFGVNLAAAPRIAGRNTASLGGQTSLRAFAPLIAASFARLIAAWRVADPAAFAQACWRARTRPAPRSKCIAGRASASRAGSTELSPTEQCGCGLPMAESS